MNREEFKARTKKFALRVMKMTDALPRNAKGKVVAHQILRSATAVASGYRAACRARSKADWVDKIGRALEEADESLLWLELTEEGGLLPARKRANFRPSDSRARFDCLGTHGDQAILFCALRVSVVIISLIRCHPRGADTWRPSTKSWSLLATLR